MIKRSFLFAASILFLALPCLLRAETKDSLPYYIQWDSVKGAGGYTVEVRAPEGDTVYERQFDASAKDAELDLPAGKYQFRIVTLNKILKPDNATDWVDIEILAVSAPVFVKLSPTALTTGKPVALTLTADRLTLAAKVALVSPSGKETPLAIKKLKTDTFALSGPALTERGRYSFVLVNSADFTTRKSNLITVNYPDFTVTSTSIASSAVTIKGKNFSKETVVYLASGPRAEKREKIPVSSLTGTAITAKLPPDLPAGDYGIFLANASDLPAKSIYAFTIAPPVVAEAEPAAIPAQEPERTALQEQAAAQAAPSLAAAMPETTPPPPAESPPAEPGIPVEPPAEPTPAVSPAYERPTAAENGQPVNAREEPAIAPEPKPAPKPVRNRIALGGGVKTDFTFGGWGDIYPGNRLSGYGFTDFYLTNNLRPKKGVSFDFSLGLRADYANMSNDGGGKYVKSSALEISGLLCPAFAVSLPWARARIHLAMGCEYISVSAKNKYGNETIGAANVDPCGGIGLSVEVPLGDYFALGVANQLLYVHDAARILKYTASTYAAVMIPIRRAE